MTDYDKTSPPAGPNSPPISAPFRNAFVALAEMQQRNLLGNSENLLWSDGPSAPPDYWRASGSPTITRTGLGEADTTRKSSRFAVKMGAGGSQGILEQRVIQPGSFDVFQEELRGSRVSQGFYLYTPDLSAVRLSIYDGVDETEGDLLTTINSFVWVPLVHDLNAAASELGVRVKANSSATVYVVGGTLWLGPVAPERPQWSDWIRRVFSWVFQDAVAVGDDALGIRHMPDGPTLVRGAKQKPGTAPSGGSCDVQFAKNGTTDIFSTKPSIPDGSTAIAKQAFDGTWENACLDQDDHVTMDVDAASGCKDLTAQLVCATAVRPLDHALDFDEID